MLSYAFTEEQEDLRQMVREFAQGEIAPLVEEAERNEQFPVEVIPMLGELGLLGIVFPEEYGGIGADKITECIFVEEMAKVCAGITASVNAHADLAAFPIYKFGTDAQRERYLPRSIAGEIIGAYAITEPDTGSDAAGLASRAEKKNGGYVINGRKNFITNGTICDYCLVAAYGAFRLSRREVLVGHGDPVREHLFEVGPALRLVIENEVLRVRIRFAPSSIAPARSSSESRPPATYPSSCTSLTGPRRGRTKRQTGSEISQESFFSFSASVDSLLRVRRFLSGNRRFGHGFHFRVEVAEIGRLLIHVGKHLQFDPEGLSDGLRGMLRIVNEREHGSLDGASAGSHRRGSFPAEEIVG